MKKSVCVILIIKNELSLIQKSLDNLSGICCINELFIINNSSLSLNKINNLYKNLNNNEMNKILGHLISFETFYQSLLTSGKLNVIKNYTKSIFLDPILIFNPRSFLIIRNILFKW